MPSFYAVLLNTMQTFEIRPTGQGKRCVLSGPLGIVDSLEIDTINEAALHAQYCAAGNDAILRTFEADGTLRDVRPIPPRAVNCIHSNAVGKSTWF